MAEPLLQFSLLQSILVSFGLLLLTILGILVFLTWKDARHYKYLMSWGGPPPLPIFGNTLPCLGLPHEYLFTDVLMPFFAKYGPSISVWLGNMGYVLFSRAPEVEKILSSTVHTNKGTDMENFLNRFIGTGLLAAPREKWLHRRKLITPAFHFKILEDFIPIFNEQSKVITIMLEKGSEGSDVLDICPFIYKCTLDIICETAMGVKINAQRGGEEEYVRTICCMTEMMITKAVNPLSRIDFLWKLTPYHRRESKYTDFLISYSRKMIDKRRALRLENRTFNFISQEEEYRNVNTNDVPGRKKVRKAFLDLLLDVQESDPNFTDDDVREEVDTFMFEGHDTTAASLDWTVLLLACNPECQELVHAELDQVFGDEMERDVTTTDLKQLKYLECCIKEALRLYPSVPMFFRRADEDIPFDEKCMIPKGAQIGIYPYLLHRNPQIFPDPEVFKPDRFTIENSAGRHPYAYIPFSAGPRNCIGQKFALMEEKIILSTILRKFRLEAVDTVTTVPAVPDVILRPKNGIRVKLIKRAYGQNICTKNSGDIAELTCDKVQRQLATVA